MLYVDAFGSGESLSRLYDVLSSYTDNILYEQFPHPLFPPHVLDVIGEHELHAEVPFFDEVTLPVFLFQTSGLEEKDLLCEEGALTDLVGACGFVKRLPWLGRTALRGTVRKDIDCVVRYVTTSDYAYEYIALFSDNEQLGKIYRMCILG